MTDHPEPAPLDPGDPTDRRVLVTLRHLRVTADDIGPSGVEALRFRMSRDDGGDLSARIAAGPPDPDPVTDGIVAALERQHGDDR